VNPSSKKIKSSILHQLETARDIQQLKAANTTTNTFPADAKGASSNDPKQSSLPKTEPRAPIAKWRPKSKISGRDNKDREFLASLGRELPSLVHIVPSETGMRATPDKNTEKVTKKVSWDPLRSRTSLEKFDIWEHAPDEDAGGRRESILPISAYDLIAADANEEIPDGYDAQVGDHWNELTLEEQTQLERWEMDLEDDFNDDQPDKWEEAKDVTVPGEEEKHTLPH
jgi:hypothetical protein